jgi:hypothetical protein
MLFFNITLLLQVFFTYADMLRKVCVYFEKLMLFLPYNILRLNTLK